MEENGVVKQNFKYTIHENEDVGQQNIWLHWKSVEVLLTPAPLRKVGE